MKLKGRTARAGINFINKVAKSDSLTVQPSMASIALNIGKNNRIKSSNNM